MLNKFNTDQIWLKAPVLFYLVGFLVHNFYLNGFYISEFNLVQTRYIFIGAICLLFIVLSAALILQGQDIGDLSKAGNMNGILSILSRAGALSLALTTITFSQAFITEKEYEKIWLMVGGGTCMLYVSWMEFQQKKWTKVTWAIFVIPLWSATLYLHSINKANGNVAAYIIGILIILLMIILGERDKKDGIPKSPFFENSEPSETRNRIMFVVGSLFFVGVFLSIIRSYAINIYPLIDKSWGGGKPVEVEIIITGNSIKGNLIDDNSEWLSLLVDNDLHRYKIQSIDEMKILSENLRGFKDHKGLDSEKAKK